MISSNGYGTAFVSPSIRFFLASDQGETKQKKHPEKEEYVFGLI
jgi:hypothetical protein